MIWPKVLICQIAAVSFFLVLISGPASLSAAEKKGVDEVSLPWTVFAGYGFSHTNLGKTRKWVETVDLVGRYELGGSEALGRSWYQGRHSLLVEIPVHFVVDPAANPMVGVNFLACYRLTSLGGIQPYGFGGGGPLYSGSLIDGMGTHWNGNWLFGIGLRLPMASGHDMRFEYRYHHISNGGRTEPNDPLNSSKLLVGISF